MEPSINISLTMLAQELLQRVKPLLKDEYEQSRLNSWVVLLILASMDLDKSVHSLQEQNNLIRGWLSKFLADIKDKNLNAKVFKLTNLCEKDLKLSTLENINQELRSILIKTQTYFEKKHNIKALEECWGILRVMHGHRKVSHLFSLLNNN